MDGIGLDGLSFTAVTPRASLQSDANNLHIPHLMYNNRKFNGKFQSDAKIIDGEICGFFVQPADAALEASNVVEEPQTLNDHCCASAWDGKVH